jgi:hypothetical protein
MTKRETPVREKAEIEYSRLSLAALNHTSRPSADQASPCALA